MQNRRAVVVAALLGVGAAGGLTGCDGEPAAPAPGGPVTIGLLVDDGSEAGTEAARAAQLAVDLVNEPQPDLGLPLAASTGLSTLGGAELALVVADTAGQPGGAEAGMDQLLGAPRLAGVVAADHAEVIATAGAYADRRQVPMVDAATSAGFLLEVGLDWYFRVTPSDRMLGEAVFALLDADPVPGAGRRVTLLAAPAGGGADIVAMLREQARAAGFTVSATVAADDDAVIELAETAPDPVVAVAATADEARLLEQVLSTLDLARPVIGMGAGFHPDRIAGPAGVVRPAAWSAEFAGRHPLAGAVAARYQDRYDTPMSGTAAAVFTATMTLAAAVEAAAATDPASVRAGLRRLSIPATQVIVPWNGVRFGEDGQNQLAAAVVEQRGEGAARLVYPPELAVTEVAWPSPAGEAAP
jgi:branched-chain amino acid transport system substrate-binding protein